MTSASVAAPALERVAALLEPDERPDDLSEAGRGGYLDLIGGAAPASTGAAQDLMLTGIVPRIYERWWRPALGRVAKGVLGPGMADERRIARLYLGLAPGDAVLDVACGTGNFTRDFARSVGADGLVVGIDVSQTMLTRAVEDTRLAGLGSAAYVRGNAQELPFRERSFDAVCCFAALHLFADPMRALDRMASVLASDGRIAIFTSCRGRSAPLRSFESVMQARSGMRMFERNEILDALEARGFVELDQRLAGFTQFVGGRLAESA